MVKLLFLEVFICYIFICVTPNINYFLGSSLDLEFDNYFLTSLCFRCSSGVFGPYQQCNSKMSCGSISPITPTPCCKPGYQDKDIKIMVTEDNDNNNSVFTNYNDNIVPEVTTTPSYRAMASSLLLKTTLTNDSSGKLRSKMIVLIWASLSTAALGTCIGLGVCLTSLDMGLAIAVLGNTK